MPAKDLLTQYIRDAKKGMRLSDIAKKLGLSTSQLKYRIVAMRKQGVPIPSHVKLKKHKTEGLQTIVRNLTTTEADAMNN